MDVNYLYEIVSFESWLETNYLPSSAQLLWYKLMMLNNRCGWSEWITVDNHRLMSIMQISREATFINIRDKLIESGLVEFKRGKKGSPNKYHINTFNIVVQSVVNSVVQSEVKGVVNTATIYKKNKTKNNISHARKNNFNDFSQRETAGEDLEKSLLSNNM